MGLEFSQPANIIFNIRKGGRYENNKIGTNDLMSYQQVINILIHIKVYTGGVCV